MPSRRLLLAAALALPALAGPVEFGMAEVQRALAARGLKPGAIRFNAEVNADQVETFRILPGLVAGGDLRGLMYGLIEAATQIRENGRLVTAKGAPATPIRGVRFVAAEHGLDQDWPEYFAMLARARLNRFTLVLAERPDAIPGGLPALRAISQTAADHAIDFVLSMESDNAAAASFDALRKALTACPAIRAVRVRAASRAAREAAFRAISQAGRRVTLELPPGPLPAGIVEASRSTHVPLRVALRYWPGEFGRPYQPADALTGMGCMNTVEPPRAYDCLWSLPAPPLLWGDPDFVRRAAPTLTLAGTSGFEIDAPRGDASRNWLYYLLWGRLTYDPKAPEKVWMAELKRRYGGAAPDVLAVYQAAGLPDPNALVGDMRFVAGLDETVRNRLRGTNSAKQTPEETAADLLDRAAKIGAVLAHAQTRIPGDNTEWKAAERDFQASARIARYRAHKLLADVSTAWFDETANVAALERARIEIAAAAAEWEDPPPDVLAEVKSVEERQEIYAQYGAFDFGFDFGARGEAAPRFDPVEPGTKYTEGKGYGWLADGDRQAHHREGDDAKPLADGWIAGTGAQVFRIRTADGMYAVSFLRINGSADTANLRARNGFLDVTFPEGEWAACGLVVKSANAAQPPPLPVLKRPPRPNITHVPPKSVPANQPLALTIRVVPVAGVKSIRLHYRTLNSKLKTLETQGVKGLFTIAAADLSTRWPLLYYFEVVNQEGTGWFEPDPRVATPYYLVLVE